MAPKRAPRSLWTGAISFGLVNVPVKLYTAVHEHKLRFHLVHEKDDGAIGYEKICKLEDKPVADNEIVKAFEVSKGKLVHVEDEDFEAAQVEGKARALELEDFVPYDQIDPTFFAHTYLVGPQDGAEHAYALLVKAMEESGLAGIGKFVMRNRQYLGCLRVRDDVLTLEQLYFADEVDPPKGIVPSKLPSVAGRELELATGLIESLAGDWKPSKYKDTYTDALMSVIKRKQKGEDVHVKPEAEEDEAPPDLMEALRASMDAVKKRGGPRSRATTRRGSSSAKRGGSSRRPRRASSSRSRR
jgi:DNA end-binding protein Ku